MSMQINLQHVFKMSTSRTHACIGTSLAFFNFVIDGHRTEILQTINLLRTVHVQEH